MICDLYKAGDSYLLCEVNELYVINGDYYIVERVNSYYIQNSNIKVHWVGSFIYDSSDYNKVIQVFEKYNDIKNKISLYLESESINYDFEEMFNNKIIYFSDPYELYIIFPKNEIDKIKLSIYNLDACTCYTIQIDDNISDKDYAADVENFFEK